MFSAIRKRMTWANVATTLALVFAMAGGAFAAGGKHHTKAHKKTAVLITSTKQLSAAVLKALEGKTGPAGSQGPAGAEGKAGANGKDGTNGTSGADGKDGVSPAGTSFNGVAHGCTVGGIEYKGATTNYVCNGKEGSPWTAGGTLPKGSSERGQWVIMAESHKAGFPLFTSLSFPIPLAAPLISERVHVIGAKEGAGEAEEAAAIKSGECTGTSKAPGAATGNLCIFVATVLKLPSASLTTFNTEGGVSGAGISGLVLFSGTSEEGFVASEGSWVVTG